MVGLGKSRMRRQRSKYMVFSWWNLPSGVSRMSRHLSGSTSPTQRLEVVARGEVAARWRPAPPPARRRRPRPGRRRASSSSMSWVSWALATSGPVQGDGGHRLIDAVLDGVESGAHWCSYRGSLGRPRVRSPIDIALDFAGSGEDSRRLIVQPRPLPAAFAGVVGGRPSTGGRRGRSTSMAVWCRRWLISLQKSLAVADSGPVVAASGQSRQHPPVLKLEQPDLGVRPGPAPGGPLGLGCVRYRRPKRNSSSMSWRWMTSWRGLVPRSTLRVDCDTRQPLPGSPTT